MPVRPRVILVVILVIAAFLLGAALTYYLARGDTGLSETNTSAAPATTDDPMPLPEPALSAPAPGGDEASNARDAAERVERVAEQQGGIDQRVAALEQRIARLDLQAEAASGNAARAEGLLIAFASRRAIERGAPLGYLADQLRLRFSDALPNAVDMVITASENPVTLDQLLARLEVLGPALAQAPPEENMLAKVRRELSELFVIRTEDTPSPRAQDRLRRARLFLESGRINSAIGVVRNMPNAGEAERWIADASRFAAAERALELLETAAILEPRRLRDGGGNRVEQPSPAVPTSQNGSAEPSSAAAVD